MTHAFDHERWFPPETALPPREEKEARAEAHFAALEAFMLEACRTVDEHDQVTPYKPLPLYDQMQYMRFALHSLVREERVLWGKSRKLSATWGLLHYVLWRVLMRPNVRVGWVSQKEADAKAAIVKYIERGLWANMPDHLKQRYTIEPAKGHFMILEKDGKPWGSEILAYPQGADQLRMLAHTVIVIDEAHLIDNLGQVLQGATPGLRPREGADPGQLVLIFVARRGSHVIKMCGGERLLVPASRMARERWIDGKKPGPAVSAV